jgi:hypothetical protein
VKRKRFGCDWGALSALAALWLGGLCGGACAPLTISREAPIDFERYPDVLVVVSSATSQAHSAYLADELADSSGFALVTTDESQPTSVRLEVAVVVTQRVEIDDEGGVDTSYDGEGRLRLVDTQTGEIVDSGAVNDTSEFYFDAFEDVLDEVALHYFRPFRL